MAPGSGRALYSALPLHSADAIQPLIDDVQSGSVFHRGRQDVITITGEVL